ncbi:hypothetical protein F7725_016315 [Dissostichus mawsoni]|uniref:Uncharacterized protein n=1 Tax=Dissostichus mawsoni TaxID=36200 RepID=A0A7J5Z1A1_DISMA|nr:hypothetical protein F7725_016315 [Dissostichus mawsoni]
MHTCVCVARTSGTLSRTRTRNRTRSCCRTMLQDLGLIGTLRDEDLSPEEPDTEPEEEDEPIVLNRKKKLGTRGVKDFNTNFEFGERHSD